jgi:hypothetical protein
MLAEIIEEIRVEEATGIKPGAQDSETSCSETS